MDKRADDQAKRQLHWKAKQRKARKNAHGAPGTDPFTTSGGRPLKGPKKFKWKRDYLAKRPPLKATL